MLCYACMYVCMYYYYYYYYYYYNDNDNANTNNNNMFLLLLIIITELPLLNPLCELPKDAGEEYDDSDDGMPSAQREPE